MFFSPVCAIGLVCGLVCGAGPVYEPYMYMGEMYVCIDSGIGRGISIDTLAS